MRARARNGRALRSRSTKGPNFHLDFVDVGVDCTDNFFRKKAIEKAILRILRLSTFSHGLDPERTLARLQKAMLRGAELHAAFGQSRSGRQGERLTPFLPATPMVVVVVIILVRLDLGIDAGKVCSVIRQPGALIGRSLR